MGTRPRDEWFMGTWHDAHDAQVPVEVAPGEITPFGTIRVAVYAKPPGATERGAYVGAIEVTADDLRTMLSGLGSMRPQPRRIGRKG